LRYCSCGQEGSRTLIKQMCDSCFNTSPNHSGWRILQRMQVEGSEMTPFRIREIFTTRGPQAAAQVAAATQDQSLVRLVEFLRKEELKSRPPMRRPGATERARESGALTRRAENRALRDAKCQARKGSASGGQKKH
jgi:hypothetical protein